MKKIFSALLLSVIIFGNFIYPIVYSEAQFAGFNFVGSPRAENEIVVNRIEDLPTPTDTADGLGTAHRLKAGNRYVIGVKDIYFTYPIVPPSDGSVTIESSEDFNIYWLGTGAFIRNNSATPLNALQLIANRIIGDGTNTAFSITDGNEISIDRTRIINVNPGIITGIDRFYFRNIAIGNQKSTLTIENIGIIGYINGSVWVNEGVIGDAYITFKGYGSIEIQNIEGVPVGGDSLFNFDSATFTGRAKVSFGEVKDIYGGIPFHANSLDQANPRIEFFSVIPIPDSQTIGSLYMERNTTVTDPAIQGETGTITAFADAGGGQVTVTSAGHGLGNGDVVWLIDDTYTGKYTISNVATDTFEITATFTSTSTGTWETGWTKVVGTTYQMENERASMTDNNKITFANLEEQKVTIHVATNPKNDAIAAAKDWEFAVMKNDVRIKGSLKLREMGVKAGEGVITATESAISGDYFEVYTRNISDSTTDMIMVNMSLVIE